MLVAKHIIVKGKCFEKLVAGSLINNDCNVINIYVFLGYEILVFEIVLLF